MPSHDPLQPIHDLIKVYLTALYTGDYKAAFACLYRPDVEELQQTLIDFAKHMEVLEAPDAFLARFNVPDMDTLAALSAEEFMVKMFGAVEMDIPQEDIQEIISKVRVLSIDHTDYLSIVKYEMPVKFMDDWEVIQTQLEVLFSENRWQILFKSAARTGLEKFKQQAEAFNERKAKDRLDRLSEGGTLTPVTLVGYQNERGEIVLEPRFKEGMEFSEGLAAVQINHTFGYIDRQGEIVIKPQFITARNFSEGLAAVRKIDNDWMASWGFINPKGETVIPFQYDEVDTFSEGRCAVQMDSKWGYIDAKGETVIPFSFEYAGEFSEGRATVELYSEEGERYELEIDRDGKILPEE